MSKSTGLSESDLLRDEPLDVIAGAKAIPPELDLLNHRSTATTVAQLVGTARGHLNVAVFGPWGSGKSSFFGLLANELATLRKPPRVLRFDAWQNAGTNFQANFLASVAGQLGQAGIEEKLFASKRSVRLPFGFGKRSRVRLSVAITVAVIVVAGLLPFGWTFISNLISPLDDFWRSFVSNALSFWSLTASGSILFLLLNLAVSLGKVDVEESRPSHIAQFRRIFDELLDKKSRYAILIDELDRCAPEAVMDTLEGLRTFLGHDRCTFVVAFDRAAVSATIAHHSRGSSPVDPSTPYYATAGEYLDKIFQFQIALPPQPARVSRRYAMSLVRDKAGVWGDLLQTGERKLERVVSALAPIHLRSPRRTKVLLNDFAVNARMYSAMGFDWLSRAEEIAVWTTLQTEFPNFAKVMETNPQAIRDSLKDGAITDPRNGTPISPDVIVETPDEDAPGIEVQADDRTRTITTDLTGELINYLRRVSENGYALPRPDLILMHAGGDLLRFDDLEIYNSLLDVEQTARSTLSGLLAAASPRDRAEALRFLLEQLEGDVTSDEEATIVVLLGDVYLRLDENARSPFSADLSRLSEKGTLDASEEPRPLAGYAVASLSTFSEKAASFLREAVERTESAEVLDLVNEALSDDLFAQVGGSLVESASLRMWEEPGIFSSLLVRSTKLGVDQNEDQLTDLIIDAFDVKQAARIAPSGSTQAAIQAAAEANEELDNERKRRLDEGFGRLSTLAAVRESVPHSSAVSGAMRRALTSSRILDGKRALRLAEDAVKPQWPHSTAEQRMDTLLTAAAERPEWIAALWRDYFVPGEAAPAEAIAEVAKTIAERFRSNTSDTVQDNAVHNMRSLLQLDPIGTLHLIPSIEVLVDFIDDEDEELVWSADMIRRTNELITLLHVDQGSGAPSAQARLLTSLAALVLNSDQENAALDVAANALSPRLVAEAIENSTEPSMGDDDLLLRMFVRVSAAGESRQLRSTEVGRLAAIGEDELGYWLRSGPPSADVVAQFEVDGTKWVDVLDVRGWSEKVSAEERTSLWAYLIDRAKPLAVAAAGEGIDALRAWDHLKQIHGMTNANERSAATKILGAIPVGSSNRKQALLAAIQDLEEGGTQHDLRTASTVALQLAQLSGVERGRMQRLLGAWVEREPRAMTQKRLRELEGAKLIAKHKAPGLLDLILGRDRRP